MSLVEETFGENLKYIHLFGLYPYKSDGIFYKIRAAIQQFLFIYLYAILSYTYLIIERKNLPMAEMAKDAFVLGEMTSFFPKYLPFYYNSERFARCLYSIENPIFKPRNQKQEAIVKDFQSTYWRNQRVFTFVAGMGVITISIRPFFLKDMAFPGNWWLPFDPESNWLIFSTIYIYQCLMLAHASFSSVYLDPLIAALASFGIAQFRILQDNLINLNTYAEEDMKNIAGDFNRDRLKSDLIYAKIKESIVHHHTIIEYLKLYEDTFSFVVFSQLFGSIAVICITCLQLTSLGVFTFEFVQMFDFLLAVLVEIFFYCYYGSMLYEENKTVLDAVYMSNWYDYDMKCKKALILFMEYAKSPKFVVVGKILDMSLNTLSTVIRRSYSLLAVLKSFQ